MENAAVFRLVAGLGNPGREYVDTRHNVGFLVAEELARRSACKFGFDAKWNAEVATCGGRALMKPQTFMNLSGEAVGGYARYFKLPVSEVLVIIDDISLPLGTLRLRRSGGSGGHNGLESVLVHLATEGVPRLRVGIGAPDGRPLHDHVLGRFLPEEREALDAAVSRAADAFEYANAHGIEAAMNQFNQRNQDPI
ncbi:MAG: aminoacyl-tRNA hydrolase [Terrimicrobiaceae bacterium]|nr:aminoacyl-tRNA hydrolase [Terrimicrobiaceae bacterium]